VLALRGSEGWESELKLDEKEKEEVVGRMKGNGILKGEFFHSVVVYIEIQSERREGIRICDATACQALGFHFPA
jgi:hypothetical protein